MSKKPSSVPFAAIAVAAALTLAACGGSGGSDSSSAATTAEAPRQGQGSGSGAGAEKHADGQGQDGHRRANDKDGQGGSTGDGQGRRHVPVAQLEVSAGGSAQFHVKGGDNSIQDYGEEAGESELRQAAEAMHAFFVASVRGEWERACGLLATDEQKSIESAAAQSPQLRGKGCAEALAAFTRPVPNSVAVEITTVDATSLRHEDEQGFLIYVGAPESTVYAMPLHLEGGAWKLSGISGVALPGV